MKNEVMVSKLEATNIMNLVNSCLHHVVLFPRKHCKIHNQIKRNPAEVIYMPIYEQKCHEGICESIPETFQRKKNGPNT